MTQTSGCAAFFCSTGTFFAFLQWISGWGIWQYNTIRTYTAGQVAQKRVGRLQRRLGEGKLLFFQLFELLYPNFVLLVSGFFIQSLFLCSSFRSHPLVCSDSKLVSTIVGAQDGWRGWDWVNLFSGVWIESDYLVVDDRLRNSGQIRLRCFSPWVLKIECCSYVSLL